jgi:formamidopyrimidine-DNA glycosylase
VHLRMTGALLFDPAVDPLHTRVRMALDGGHRLIYVDPRRFGTGHLVLGEAERNAYLNERLGVEPMTPAFTAEHLRAIARGRTAPVKAFVLDQRRIAGVGNIYADEALFRAGIHPLRPAGALTRAQLRALRDGIEASLRDGIDAKGATIDDFRHVDGAHGSFQDRFLVHLREGEPCVNCGTMIRKLVVGGRGTYVCEHCQPRPRARRRPAQPTRT